MTSPEIESIDLSYSYTRKKMDVDSLSLQVPNGSIYGFLGRNGSGKTTTIRLLMGLLKPGSGQVKVFNKSVRQNRKECLTQIGALIERPALYEHLSAEDNLQIMASYYGNISPGRIPEVLEIVGLGDTGRKKVRGFSLGMKQKLGLACSILHKPRLLILDEPTNGLDPQGILEIRNLLINLNKKEGTTIFLSSHMLSEVEKLCTHIGIIKRGKMIYQGRINEPDSMEQGIHIQIETNDLEKTNKIVQDFTLRTPIFTNGHLLLSLRGKREIPVLIDQLREKNIDVYELKIKNDLERFFLDQTRNSL